jgi:hypothetical protein
LEIRRLRAGIDGPLAAVVVRGECRSHGRTRRHAVQGRLRAVPIGRALRLRGGQFKLPGGREYGTSMSSLDFLERSACVYWSFGTRLQLELP